MPATGSPLRQLRRRLSSWYLATFSIILLLLGGGLFLAIVLMQRSELLRTRLAAIPAQLERNGLDIRIYNWQAALDQFAPAMAKRALVNPVIRANALMPAARFGLRGPLHINSRQRARDSHWLDQWRSET